MFHAKFPNLYTKQLPEATEVIQRGCKEKEAAGHARGQGKSQDLQISLVEFSVEFCGC